MQIRFQMRNSFDCHNKLLVPKIRKVIFENWIFFVRWYLISGLEQQRMRNIRF